MIADTGTGLLIASFIAAMWQTGLGLYGVQQAAVRGLSAWVSVLQSMFLMMAFCTLAYAFLMHDFSLQYVAAHSHVDLPWIYCITAVWGGHEGSMLLWLTLLSLWQVAVVLVAHQHKDAFYSATLGVLGAVSVAFHSFVLLTSNPFARRWPPFETVGQDLNPLLQDPGLVSHPPMLYMGYVGFGIVFAMALAKLWVNLPDETWAKRTKPWCVAAWSCLTLGITLGSWWAYRVLGWGGWWFWDPVENASFMPWLAGTALLHVLLIVQHRQRAVQLALALAITTFALSLIGTFLVRSGILVSVHAFASDPSRGLMMLWCFMILIGGALALFIWRYPKSTQSLAWSFFSREWLLLGGSLLLTMSMVTVLLGTLYPLVMDVLNLSKLSIGPPYFNTVFTPFMMMLLLCMGLAPLMPWRKSVSNAPTFKQQLVILTSVSVILPLLTFIMFRGPFVLSTVLTLTLATWVLTGLLMYVRRVGLSKQRMGMLIAHAGFIMTVLGVGLASTTTLQRDVLMQVGESLNLGPYTFAWQTLSPVTGQNYDGQAAVFEVTHTDTGRRVKAITAEKRVFRVDKTPLAKPGIHAGVWRDIYIALGRDMEDNTWQVRVYVKPFVRWIWTGGMLMVIGGVCTVIWRRA